jgi:hypothetical protein
MKSATMHAAKTNTTITIPMMEPIVRLVFLLLPLLLLLLLLLSISKDVGIDVGTADFGIADVGIADVGIADVGIYLGVELGIDNGRYIGRDDRKSSHNGVSSSIPRVVTADSKHSG